MRQGQQQQEGKTAARRPLPAKEGCVLPGGALAGILKSRLNPGNVS